MILIYRALCKVLLLFLRCSICFLPIYPAYKWEGRLYKEYAIIFRSLLESEDLKTYLTINNISYSVIFMDNSNEKQALFKATMTGADLKIVQNSSTNEFYIEGIEDTARLVLSDQDYKVLHSEHVENEEDVLISSLPKGIYIVRIITESAVVVKELEK